jgi:cell division protease FtsH
VTQRKNVSAQTAIDIDNEIRAVVDKCYAIARDLLESHRAVLDAMADALIKYETIDAAQIDDLMEGKEPRPPHTASGLSEKKVEITKPSPDTPV